MILGNRVVNDEAQILHKFDNGFGASVVRHANSYEGTSSLWELAVLKFEGDTWGITYDTPITDDVLRYSTDADIKRYLKEIEAL